MFRCENWCLSFFGIDGTWWSSGWWIMCLVGMIIMLFLFLYFFISTMRRCRSSGLMGMFSTKKYMNESDLISSTVTAKDILDKRYALGEVNKEEYNEMQKNLS